MTTDYEKLNAAIGTLKASLFLLRDTKSDQQTDIADAAISNAIAHLVDVRERAMLRGK